MKVEAHINSSLKMDEFPFEVVERKGLGHPDTICDLLTDQISKDLAQYYLKTCGKVLHYNLDKALLVAGNSKPQFNGGKILEPVKFYLGDRATTLHNGQILKLEPVIESSMQSWLTENLRHLRLNENLFWKNEIRSGSAMLNSVEERNVSNDTSAGVGYWPLSTLENLVLDIEKQIKYSEIGEDVKVMAIRQGQKVEIILACAFIDKYISSVLDYSEKKDFILQKIKSNLTEKYKFDLSFSMNILDDYTRGLEGIYLTVTGLSCENADSGQVGRGNRVSGLISFMRPQTMEAWAGKNFQTHVGKMYSFKATEMAKSLVENIAEVSEVTITLVGKIGNPVNEPAYIFCDFKMSNGNEAQIKEKVLKILKY